MITVVSFTRSARGLVAQGTGRRLVAIDIDHTRDRKPNEEVPVRPQALIHGDDVVHAGRALSVRRLTDDKPAILGSNLAEHSHVGPGGAVGESGHRVADRDLVP